MTYVCISVDVMMIRDEGRKRTAVPLLLANFPAALEHITMGDRIVCTRAK